MPVMIIPKAKTEQIHVAVYCRKSTDAKLEQQVNSISVQRAAAKSYIDSQQHLGWQCLDEEFSDNNVSGAILNREALNRLVQRITEGKVKVVVVNRLDRISRSLSQFLELMAFFEKHGVALVSVTQNINTSDAMGRLMLQIIMSFAEFERELICDRVTERMCAARKNGQFVGGRPPLGYKIKPEGGELEIDELEAIRVREIFELYLELRSVKATACELKCRGLFNKKWITRQGNVCGGNPFSISGLHNLLTNRVYVGEVLFKGEIFDGKHDGIIDPRLFEQVQSVLANNSVQKGNRKRNSHSALLKGLLICKTCGTAFVHCYAKKSTRIYRYYSCGRRRLEGSTACSTPSIPAGEIESLVVDQLMSIGTNPDLQEEVYRQLVDALERKQVEAKKCLKTALEQRNRLERELASSREFEAPLTLIKHLESKKQDAEELLKDSESDAVVAIPSRADVAGVLQDMQGLWPTFNTGEKCAFVKALVRKVEYDSVEGRITLHFNDDGFMPSTTGGAQ
jgi:site-specific DNA recombinase